MSPRNVPGVGLGDPDVLARLAVEQPDAAALDDEERGVALPLRVERLARRVASAASPRSASFASLASDRRGNITSSSRSGNSSARELLGWSPRSSWRPRRVAQPASRARLPRMPPFALDRTDGPPRVGVLDQPVRRLRAAAAPIDAWARAARRRASVDLGTSAEPSGEDPGLPARDRARRRRHDPARAAARDGASTRRCSASTSGTSASSPTSAASSSAPRWTRSPRGDGDGRRAHRARRHVPHRAAAPRGRVQRRRRRAPARATATRGCGSTVGDEPLLQLSGDGVVDRVADRLDRVHGRRRRPGGRTEPRRHRASRRSPARAARCARSWSTAATAVRVEIAPVERAAQRRDRRADDRRPADVGDARRSTPRRARRGWCARRPRTFYCDLAGAIPMSAR